MSTHLGFDVKFGVYTYEHIHYTTKMSEINRYEKVEHFKIKIHAALQP